MNVFVHRFSTAKPEVLHSQVSNNDPLIRFLAIQTIGLRRLHLESDLIERLNDPDQIVRDAVRAALVRVARGTDFGPFPGASRRSVERSIEKWKLWLSFQQSASPETLAKEAAIAAAGYKAKVAPLEIVPLIFVDDEQKQSQNRQK